MTTDEQVGYVISALRGHLELTTAEAEAIAVSVLEVLPSTDQHIRITCDMEAYALAFNEGYETAMAQRLAPEVETATEFSEFDAAPSKILAHHWPNVPNYGDMTKIDWAAIEPVDIISGGTPCQDLSNAGRRAGMNEGTRSNLWVQMREAIAIQRPKYVVWENVRGAFSACASSEMGQCQGCMDGRGAHKPFLRALGRVLGDLSDLGYDCQWRGLRASDVGACHPRFRVFVLGSLRDANSADVEGKRAGGVEVSHLATGTRERGGAGPSAADATMRGWDEVGPSAPCEGCEQAGGCGCDPLTTDPSRQYWGQRRLPASSEATCGQPSAVHPGRSGTPTTANPAGNTRRKFDGNDEDIEWGDYEPAIQRWEAQLGRAAPRPTEPTGRNGAHRLSPRFTEWMMGLPDGWVTDPAIGISRNEQLKACGNGVVPQQAMAALRDLLAAFENQEIAA